MEYDLIIIGSGPGGYVPAIRAGQTGLRTAIIEKDKTGGMCLNSGCIPTKSLIESAKLFKKIQNAGAFGIDGINNSLLTFNYSSAVKRTKRVVARLTKGVEFLLKKHGVELIKGEAFIKDRNTIVVNDRLLKTKNIIISTGSIVSPLPDIFKNTQSVNVEEMLELKELPEDIIIYGSGIHAIELAQFVKMTGRNVSIITFDTASLEDLDDFLVEQIYRKLKKEKINIIELKDITVENDNVFIPGNDNPADIIINAGKRIAVFPPSELDLKESKGFIETDEKFRCSEENIFAVGDVNGRSYFAHAASAQGIFVVNNIRGVKSEYNPVRIPFNIYTYPEMAQIGLTMKDLTDRKVDYKVSEFSLMANGKALSEGESEGMVRILSEKKYGEVLGVQIIAQNATDMIAEASALMSIEGTVFDVANIIHAHPTVSEVFYEAGLDALDMAIHK